MKNLLLTLLFLMFNNLVFAQTDSVFVWENYLPKSEVDSILILSTDTLEIVKEGKGFFENLYKNIKGSKKKRQKIISQRWEGYQAHKKKINTMLTYGKFNLNNYQEYVNHYEKQYSITDSTDIKNIVSLFYERNDCTEVEQLFCIAKFREIVIFFKDGKPFFAMKICFGCKSIATTSPRDLECFKSSDSFENVIREWEKRGWLKNRKKFAGRY